MLPPSYLPSIFLFPSNCIPFLSVYLLSTVKFDSCHILSIKYLVFCLFSPSCLIFCLFSLSCLIFCLFSPSCLIFCLFSPSRLIMLLFLTVYLLFRFCHFLSHFVYYVSSFCLFLLPPSNFLSIFPFLSNYVPFSDCLFIVSSLYLISV